MEKEQEVMKYELSTETAMFLSALKSINEANEYLKQGLIKMYGKDIGLNTYADFVEDTYLLYREHISDYLTDSHEKNLLQVRI